MGGGGDATGDADALGTFLGRLGAVRALGLVRSAAPRKIASATAGLGC
jgi:hypothetical protein